MIPWRKPKIRLLFWLGLLTQTLAGRAFAPDIKTGSLDGFTWQTGQIISSSQFNTFQYEARSGSRHGHIGIVAVEDGKVYVYEANPVVPGRSPENGVQRTPLELFLKGANTGTDGHPQVSVSSYAPPLKDAEKESLLATLKETLKQGITYDFVHDHTAPESSHLSDAPKRLDCATYVAFAIRKWAKESRRPVLGELQTLRALVPVGGNPTGKAPFPETILDMQLLSPFSIVSSPALKVEFSNLPVGTTITGREVLEAWRDALEESQYKKHERSMPEGAKVPYPNNWNPQSYLPPTHQIRRADCPGEYRILGGFR